VDKDTFSVEERRGGSSGFKSSEETREESERFGRIVGCEDRDRE
jgi:hypothetical protein